MESTNLDNSTKPSLLQNRLLSDAITATELRIGNWVLKSLKSGNGRKRQVQVEISDLVRISSIDKTFIFSPILLTEEWLMKLGFISDVKKEWWSHPSEKGIILGYVTNDEYWQFDFMTMFPMTIDVKSVHHLQNLFFALSGKELEFNVGIR